jgi:hypothetical protein
MKNASNGYTFQPAKFTSSSGKKATHERTRHCFHVEEIPVQEIKVQEIKVREIKVRGCRTGAAYSHDVQCFFSACNLRYEKSYPG